MIGAKIETLQDLEAAAENKKSVIVHSDERPVRFFGGRLPAAFMMSMQAREVLRAIKTGLYVYEKGETK